PTTANFKTSAASPQYFQKVSPAITTTTVTSSLPGGVTFGRLVTFTAVVTANTGGTPTTVGTSMKFFNGAALLGTGSLLATTANPHAQVHDRDNFHLCVHGPRRHAGNRLAYDHRRLQRQRQYRRQLQRSADPERPQVRCRDAQDVDGACDRDSHELHRHAPWR